MCRDRGRAEGSPGENVRASDLFDLEGEDQ
jgi:hypothetical protein